MKPAHAYLRTQACFCCESWSTEGLLSKDLAPLASFKREINASVITNATEKAMMPESIYTIDAMCVGASLAELTR